MRYPLGAGQTLQVGVVSHFLIEAESDLPHMIAENMYIVTLFRNYVPLIHLIVLSSQY